MVSNGLQRSVSKISGLPWFVCHLLKGSEFTDMNHSQLCSQFD